MRPLIMWNLVTLDGFFEGAKSWDLAFHETVWGDELERISIDQLRGADCLLFGRTTYEGMAAYWAKATGTVAELMNGIRKVVFSRTLARADWNNTRLVAGPAEEEVSRIKGEPGKDILIFGSANLTDSLSRRGLIDEYRIGLVPVVLGVGNPLFKAGNPMQLHLAQTTPLESGCTILRLHPREGPR